MVFRIGGRASRMFSRDVWFCFIALTQNLPSSQPSTDGGGTKLNSQQQSGKIHSPSLQSLQIALKVSIGGKKVPSSNGTFVQSPIDE